MLILWLVLAVLLVGFALPLGLAAVSGFNRPSQLLPHVFSDIAGGLFSLLVPYMGLLVKFKFGPYADITAL